MAQKYIERENSSKIKDFINSDIIKIVTGPRRAGKSIYCTQLLKGKKFAYLNFDDENLIKFSHDDIMQGLYEVYPEFEIVFFDEIQNVENWELFVNKLHRRGINLLLTGSNARLLAGEMATSLTGRHITAEVLPFSLREYLKAAGEQPDYDEDMAPELKGKLLSAFDKYALSGGYPEVVTKGMDVKAYLGTLFDAVLFKDIVKRHRVKYSKQIYDLAVYLISNFSNEFSYSGIRKMLSLRSTNTVEKYTGYLEESYMYFVLNRFSYKFKQQINAPKKIYLSDNGLINARAFQVSGNAGKLLENVCFCEMLRRGYVCNESIFYYKTEKGLEVDFALKNGPKVNSLVQVCRGFENGETKDRELKALMQASEELNCDDLLVITRDTEEEIKIKNKEIKVMPVLKFLLKYNRELK